MNIPLKVKNLYKKFGTKDTYKLCHYLGIDIQYKDLGKTKGIFKKILSNKYIVINENLNELDSLIVLSHELGHSILHSSKTIRFMQDFHTLPKTSIWEKEANQFAVEILKYFNFDIFHCNSVLTLKTLNELVELANN